MKRDTQISVRMPTALRAQLEALAAAERRSLADLIVLTLEDRVKTAKAKTKQ